MSDQYYTQEDVLPDTPAQAIQNWEAQSNSLAHVVPEVAARLNETGAYLGELYHKAQAAGDTRGMEIISASWQHIETIGNQTVQIDALGKAAAEVLKTISKTMGDLEEAIASGDERHPMLQEYAADIRQDAAEATYDQAMEEAYEYASELQYEAAMDNLKEATGCEWEQCSLFWAFLEGEHDLSPMQSAMLKDLIESLGADTD